MTTFIQTPSRVMINVEHVVRAVPYDLPPNAERGSYVTQMGYLLYLVDGAQLWIDAGTWCAALGGSQT